MPSFFSRKSRSQAYEGPPAEPAPPPSDPYQLHHQQHQQPFLDQTRRPSLPVHVLAGHLHTQNTSSDNLNSPALDRRYDDIPPDHQHHRHPAHRNTNPAAAQPPNPSTSSDRPTISLVGPAEGLQLQHHHHHHHHHQQQQQQQQQGQLDAANYNNNNSTSDLDRSSVEQQSWSSAHASSQDLSEKPSKLHKKKGFFSRHQSSASTSQGKTASKPEISLGRSVSIKHKFGSSISHNNTQQRAVDQKPQLGEHALGRLQTSQAPIQQQQQQSNVEHDTTTPIGDPPGSPSVYVPSSPHTPLDPPQRLDPDLHDHSYRGLQHHRTGSADSFPSQVSLQQQHYIPSYQDERQPPSPLFVPPAQHDFPTSLHPHHPAHQHPIPVSVSDSPSSWHNRLPIPDQLSLPARPSSQQSSLGRASPLLLPQTQSSDLLVPQVSSRRPSAQHPALAQLAASDMAAIDRAGGARPSDSQSQLPSRKDSLAAQGGQSPYPNVPQGSSFKGNISQQNLAETTGRETPPAASASSKLQEELENIDVAAMLQRHEELQAKYIKVKRYYFEKEAQVTQLQNTVAHQRMAVSRTVLDDNEYAARFSRLDGAIKELSFSIRKDWKTIPDWLHSSVNEDAVTVGTKEMTGVGRAVISRWIAEEIFERYFHPGLERTFSERLKTIEANLRRQQVQAFTEDDKENQVARISNWRRTTLDGLSDMLQSKTTQENQAQLADYLVEKLSATLQCDLKDPPPPELTHGARTIVENAINIIEKIPQESRDIIVDYIVPGSPVSESTMKIETGLPPLTRAISGGKDHSPPTDRGRDSADDMDADKDPSNNSPQGDHRSSPTHFPQNRDQRKKYPFGSLMSKKSMASSNPTTPVQSSSPSDARPGTNSDSATNNTSKDRDEQSSQADKRLRVRFATFMTVEVRGRGPNNVLVQAPVYTLESS